MLLNMIAQTLITGFVMGFLLFGAAGTLRWTGAWVYLIEFITLSLGIGLALARVSPELLQERLKSPVQHGQAGGDRLFMAAMLVLWTAWMIFMGLDAVRWRRSHVPVWAQVAGALIIALSLYGAYRAMLENRFAAPVVKIQETQRVIDTGPYRLVRHPMYAAALPIFVGMPLLLGSWWGLAAFPVATVGIALRIGVEEKTLRAALPDYEAYAKRVRYRLAPGLW